jgi:hypothetical protein
MKSFVAILGIALLAAPSAWAACSYPQGPDRIPDGNTATEDEMKDAQRAVRKYNEDINIYLTCIKDEHVKSIERDAASLTEEQKKERERMQVQKHNAAIDELEAVAARFNEQVKVFKAKEKAGRDKS